MRWSPRILVVEDHEPARELIVEALQAESPTLCDRLDQALRMAEGHDLVVLDLGLPDSHGAETLRRFLEVHPHLPIVVLTDTDDPALGEQLIGLGAEDYLPKRELRSRLSTVVLHALVRHERQATHARARTFATSVLSEALTGFALVRLPDHIVYSNRAIREVLGLGPDQEPILPAELKALATTPGAQKIRVHLARGTVRWLHARVSRVELDGAERLISVDDITESVELESHLAHAQRLDAMGRIAGGVAHDLNNCLTAIRAFAEFARQGVEAGETRRDLDEVLLATSRAEKLTSQLLAFSRRKRITPTVVSPSVLVYDLTRMLTRVLGDGVEVEASSARDTPKVWADKTALEQVLVNLVVNARDALGGPGRVQVHTDLLEVSTAEATRLGLSQAGAHARIRVVDEGCGMPASVLKRAFEPFFTTKPQDRGTGLGLATSYGLIVQAGGQLFAESVEGQGTTMTVLLPAHDDSNTSVSDSPSNLGPATARGRRILVAEDNPRVRRAVQRTLLDAGYQVFAEGDGHDALATLASLHDPVHLLVTDLLMPRMGGQELLQRVRALHPELPVVVMSGFSESYELNEPFLDKPFPPEKLTLLVSDLLRSQPPRETKQLDPLEGRAQVAEGFEAALSHVIASGRDQPTVGVWADGKVAYLNDAFVRFALKHGASQLLADFGIGQPALAAVPQPIAERFRPGWELLMAGRSWRGTIELNTSTNYRSFEVTATPATSGAQVVGALICLRIRTQSPMHRANHAAAATLSAPGATLCANCGRTQRTDGSAQEWVWVGANVDRPPDGTRYALCDRCDETVVLEALPTS